MSEGRAMAEEVVLTDGRRVHDGEQLCHVTQVGDLFEVRFGLPVPVNGVLVEVIVRGAGSLTEAEVRDQAIQPYAMRGLS